MDYSEKIIRDPNICGGEPVIKGTRIPLRTVLASLADGDGFDQILEDYPSLTTEDLQAVVAFAAASAEEDLPITELPEIS